MEQYLLRSLDTDVWLELHLWVCSRGLLPAIRRIIRLENGGSFKRMVGAGGKNSHSLQSSRGKKLPHTVVQRAGGRQEEIKNDGWCCIEMVGGGALPASVLHPPVLTCSALTSRRSASDRHFAC